MDGDLIPSGLNRRYAQQHQQPRDHGSLAPDYPDDSRPQRTTDYYSRDFDSIDRPNRDEQFEINMNNIQMNGGDTMIRRRTRSSRRRHEQ